MKEHSADTTRPRTSAVVFRTALFAAAASLAAYVPYKYLTELHAVEGMYAFLFPFAPILAIAGLVLAVKPSSGCDCGVGIRSGVGTLSILWLATGMVCTQSLAAGVMAAPAAGLLAAFQMVAQHVFLSLAVLAFAWKPLAMSAWLKTAGSVGASRAGDEASSVPPPGVLVNATASRPGH